MKRGTMVLKIEVQKVIEGRHEIKLEDITEALEISPQKAGSLLRKIGWRNACPYSGTKRENAVFVPVEV